ncbi:MAG: hypothetical protein QF464_07405, partial [Myxococcota bacterium]|nr:hypothetical protein [Myxococcota bacterium]
MHIGALLSRLASALTMLCLLAPTTQAFGPDWPLPHGDRRMTRTLAASGAITEPTVHWSKRLGGAQPSTLVQDVDGDGLDEILQLVGGRLVAMDPLSGATQWSTAGLALGRFMLDGDGRARDLDGDGVVDIVVSKSNMLGDARVYVIDGKTGDIHWQFGEGHGPTSGRGGGNQHFLGDVDQDDVLEFVLYIPLATGTKAVYCFDFSSGYDGDVLQWTATGFTYGGTMRVPMFDVTGDGNLELLLNANGTMYVFDGTDGALMGTTPNWLDGPVPAEAGPLYAVQVDDDPAWEIGNDKKNAGGWVGVYDVDATTGTVHKRWRVEITTPSINQGPLDHNADGRAEVVMSTYDTSSSTWTVQVLDGGTGETLATLDGAAISRIGPDLKGDGTSDIVVSFTDAYPLPAFDDFHALLWDGAADLSTRWVEPLEQVQFRAVL